MADAMSDSPANTETFDELNLLSIEVEDFDLAGLIVEGLPGVSSGGQHVRIADFGAPAGTTGTASAAFGGPSGFYDVILAYYDENDGQSTIDITIGDDGTQVLLDQDSAGGVASAATRSEATVLSGVSIDNGDAIVLTATLDPFEFARMDLLTFQPTSGPSDQESEVIGLEVEAMSLSGLTIENLAGISSGGEHVRIADFGAPAGTTGTASSVFQGPSGTYNVSLAYYDERDGQSELSLAVGDDTVSLTLDQDLPSGVAAAESRVEAVLLHEIDILNGDVITLTAVLDDAEFVRMDRLQFELVEGAGQAPVAEDDDLGEVFLATPVTVSVADLLANDHDPEGGEVSLGGLGEAVGGVVSLDQAKQVVAFRPDPGFIGTAQFSYEVIDDDGMSDRASVRLEVRAEAGLGELGELPGLDGLTLFGAEEFALAGTSAAFLGDVNGDGIDDIGLVAAGDSGGGPLAGAAYVIFGGQVLAAETSLASVAGGNVAGFRLDGNTQGYNSVVVHGLAAGGDINGDGFGDVLVTAGDLYGTEASSYVVFGGPQLGGLGTSGLGLGGTYTANDVGGPDLPGFRFEGPSTGRGYATGQLAGVGDIDGDGFDDLAYRATVYEGEAITGRVHVLYGGQEFGPLVTTYDVGSGDLAGFVLEGGADLQAVPRTAVSSAGDLNGDGFDDMVLGASDFHVGYGLATTAGQAAYVIFGGQALSGRHALSEVGTGDLGGLILQGDTPSTDFAQSLAAAGDVNGDGVDDLLVGAPYGNAGEGAGGTGYVLFGDPSLSGALDFGLVDDGGLAGLRLTSDLVGDRLAQSLATAGDLNGDGFNDVVFGAPQSDTAGTFAGAAHILFGQPELSGGYEIGQLLTGEILGFRLTGDAALDLSGQAVAGGGDFNGDGFDDLIIAAPGDDSAGSSAGAAHLIFGGGFTNQGTVETVPIDPLPPGPVLPGPVSSNLEDQLVAGQFFDADTLI